MHDYFYRFMSFLEELIPAILILLPVVLYYLHRRNVLRTQKEILLKEIEKGSIVDPELLAKSLTSPVSEEERLQHNLRCGIIFSLAGIVILVATSVFYSYLRGVYAVNANGTTFDPADMARITLVVTLVMVVAGIVLSVGIPFLVSYFNQKKKMQKTA